MHANSLISSYFLVLIQIPQEFSSVVLRRHYSIFIKEPQTGIKVRKSGTESNVSGIMFHVDNVQIIDGTINVMSQMQNLLGRN